MIKRVDGSEFQVSKRTIAATKLQEEDRLVAVKVVTEQQNVVLQTKNGYFLRFLSADVPEKKKAVKTTPCSGCPYGKHVPCIGYCIARLHSEMKGKKGRG